MNEYCSSLETQIGTLCITATDKGIAGIAFGEGKVALADEAPVFLHDCMRQLHEYFEGKRREFSSLPLVLRGTEFQQTVWDETMRVNYGSSISYGALAKAIGDAHASRAVGTALGRNQLGIIIPCHRIVSSDARDIGGFAWGKERKEWLLRHEAAIEKAA